MLESEYKKLFEKSFAAAESVNSKISDIDEKLLEQVPLQQKLVTELELRKKRENELQMLHEAFAQPEFEKTIVLNLNF